MASANPNILCEVDLQRGPSVTGEEEVLHIHIGGKVRVRKVDNNRTGSVFVVHNQILEIVRSDVHILAFRPLEVPPARGNANLIPVAVSERDIERLGLHPLPGLGRKLDESLTVGIRAFEAEAVCTVPADGAKSGGIRILPDHFFHSLPVSAIGCRLEVELVDVERLAVDRGDLTGDGCLLFRHLLGKGDDDGAGALAVELGILDQLDGSSVRAEEFNSGDELQVFTVDGELVTAVDDLVLLLGETFDHGFANRQFNRGFSLVVVCLDDKLTGCNAVGHNHAEHIVRYFREVGNGLILREYNLGNVVEAGAVDCNLQAGDDLCGEHGFDSQTDLFRSVDILREAGCNCKTHQSD